MIAVYVPVSKVIVGSQPAKLPIAAKSGVVGRPSDISPLAVDLWYEGNLYGAVNLGRYVERVRQAAGRMEQNYPTVAHMTAAEFMVVQVGEYDAEADEVLVTDPTRLAAWLEIDWTELEFELRGQTSFRPEG